MVITAMKTNTHINPYSAVFALNLSRQIKNQYNAISVNHYNAISVNHYNSISVNYGVI